MFQYAGNSMSISDQISIAWWRMVIYTTRLLNRVKQQAVPICSPLYPYLWIPAMALVVGLFIGWAIAFA
jgi:hypothetical protein